MKLQKSNLMMVLTVITILALSSVVFAETTIVHWNLKHKTQVLKLNLKAFLFQTITQSYYQPLLLVQVLMCFN